jgi:hypothetical protein
MFTWICPRCGREVPPSYTECPDCGKAEQASAAGTAGPAPPTTYGQPAAVSKPPAPAPVPSQPSYLDLLQEPSPAPPPQPVYRSEPAAPPVYQAPAAPPPVYQAPPPPAYEPPARAYQESPRPPSTNAPASFLGLGQTPVAQPATATAVPAGIPVPGPALRGGLPTWLLTILFAAGFVVVVGGVYWLVGGSRSTTNAKPSASVAQPAATPGGAPNPYQKYIEISGVRFLEGPKKAPQVKFVVINHSGAEIDGLGGNVNIVGRTDKSQQAAGSFHFSTNIGAWESKDLTVPLETKLEMIELPDWQYVTTDVQITSPAQ